MVFSCCVASCKETNKTAKMYVFPKDDKVCILDKRKIYGMYSLFDFFSFALKSINLGLFIRQPVDLRSFT